MTPRVHSPAFFPKILRYIEYNVNFVESEIEEMKRKMQEEIREQLLANQQMMDDNTGFADKLLEVKF